MTKRFKTLSIAAGVLAASALSMHAGAQTTTGSEKGVPGVEVNVGNNASDRGLPGVEANVGRQGDQNNVDIGRDGDQKNLSTRSLGAGANTDGSTTRPMRTDRN